MNKKIILSIVLFATVVSCCGCSWAKSFSEEDTKNVAAYSAKIIAKYNTRQQDGIVHIDESDEKSVANDRLKELAKLENSSNTTSSNSTSSSSSSSSSSGSATAKSAVSLSTALGVSGVDFTYQGYDVKDDYVTNVYNMSPNSGYKFLVMKFQMSNTSAGDVDVNIISMNAKFKATINGGTSATNDLTLIPEDLATYKGTLRAGESTETVIIFQFKSEDLENIQSISLQCTVNGSTNDITL